ncbi:hypothetical protein [Rhodanobacter sp. T12-5]|uniref:hypothetical protein n=1 Tax=Rhodanobacter sp. T12-5 TaxID=2024611 RepID=UPI0011EC3B57|nr:hypothetical protein [Rhodanobacter sp. T12-5]KAA0068667.1 hypothetical protein CIW53_15455 [Rhodanobacter sp. T12-5]
MQTIPKPRPDGIVRFGKRKARRDDRNLMFAVLLKAPPVLPAEYDFDVVHHGIPTPMFGNDQYGDCVIAGRAHQTLRFERAEQNKLIAISDHDVLQEYFSESGGVDSGLVVLDSVKEWRSKGWLAAKRRYKIKAFAQIDQRKRSEVKRAVFMGIGVGLGLTLPDAALTQFYAGKPWAVVGGKAGQPNPHNGHYVYVPGYTKLGPVCVTWGRKQQMTWPFLARYCDEAYAIIDAIDTAKKRRALDATKLDAFLAGLRKRKPTAAKKAPAGKRLAANRP